MDCTTLCCRWKIIFLNVSLCGKEFNTPERMIVAQPLPNHVRFPESFPKRWAFNIVTHFFQSKVIWSVSLFSHFSHILLSVRPVLSWPTNKNTAYKSWFAINIMYKKCISLEKCLFPPSHWCLLFSATSQAACCHHYLTVSSTVAWRKSDTCLLYWSLCYNKVS